MRTVELGRAVDVHSLVVGIGDEFRPLRLLQEFLKAIENELLLGLELGGEVGVYALGFGEKDRQGFLVEGILDDVYGRGPAPVHSELHLIGG